MLGWSMRMLLVVAGSIASWFVARDALNFNIIQQMVVALCVNNRLDKNLNFKQN